MEEVVLVSGCRTPIGRLSGGFENTSASDLAAIVIREAVSFPARADNHAAFSSADIAMAKTEFPGPVPRRAACG